jgi:hypothetical protein
MPARYTGPAMTLENMRQNGVRSIEQALRPRAFPLNPLIKRRLVVVNLLQICRRSQVTAITLRHIRQLRGDPGAGAFRRDLGVRNG